MFGETVPQHKEPVEQDSLIFPLIQGLILKPPKCDDNKYFMYSTDEKKKKATIHFSEEVGCRAPHSKL